jgi:multimeric flavodoxin WrbA
MKVLVVIGSQRKRGNTARIVALITERMAALGNKAGRPLEIEWLFLGQHEINPCLGCRACFNRGESKCPMIDDLPAVKARMLAADALIIATPVYVNDVSGLVKNWIDRLAHVCHRPEFAGKCAYLVATVGEGPTNHALKTLKLALGSWGYFIAGQTGFKMGALMRQPEMEAAYRKRTDKIAGRLYSAVAQKRYLKPTFLSLMTFKIQQRHWQRVAEKSLDLDYWQERGWTAPSQAYYIGQRANPLKVILARLSGSLIARFVT